VSATMKTTAVEPKNNRGLLQKLKDLTSVIVSRATLAGQLGESFGGDRELYTACGYPFTITFQRYNGRYTRQDIAKRIVNAYPDATWRGVPEVYETEKIKEKGKETDFETAWNELIKTLPIYHYLNRIDRVAGIGRYGVLLLGFDDGRPYSSPVQGAKELLFLQPYSENNAGIDTIITDRKDKRYGLPEYYKMKMGAGRNESGPKMTTTIEERVHWSRVIHVAENCAESDVYGTPRLECVYNRLQDVETISGGSAEMFWRGAFPGYAFEADTGTTVQSTDALDDEIEAYMHGLTRVLRLQGIKANALTPEVANPKNHIEIQLQLISGATGIPVRILTGSERGELASSQDQTNWEHKVDERRKSFAGPSILAPFIDRLIEFGVLPTPKEDYIIQWPDIGALDAKEQAEVAKNKTEALAKYVTSGADAVIPPQMYLTTVLGYSDEEATAMLEAAMEIIQREELEPIDDDDLVDDDEEEIIDE